MPPRKRVVKTTRRTPKSKAPATPPPAADADTIAIETTPPPAAKAVQPEPEPVEATPPAPEAMEVEPAAAEEPPKSKKRVVKATRRTPRSTAKSKSLTPPPEPQSPPAAAETSSVADAAIEITPPPVAEPPSADAVKLEPLKPEPVEAAPPAPEAMEVEPAAVEEALKPIEELAAAGEAPKPIEEPTTVEEAPKPIEEPAAAEEAPKPSEEQPSATRKTVTRVRKVVKKKIIVKKVPKGTLSASSASAAATAPQQEETKTEGAAEQIPNSDSQPVPETKNLIPDPLLTEESIAPAQPGRVVEMDKQGEVQEPNKQKEVQEAEKQEDVPELDKQEEVLEAKKQEEALEAEKLGEAVMAALMEADKMEEAEKKAEVVVTPGDEEKGISERRRRRKTEIFIGGLEKDTKEEDIRKVFGTVGEIVEVRIIMDSQTGRNKGYGFLRYAEAAQAKKAVQQFEKVEVCGKVCGAAPLDGNDTIFLGNIDKKWKKEDVIKLLEEIGIDKIDTVTVMTDPSNAEFNRGFAFLELETNRDAQNAYRKLQKKDVFGKGRNIKVAWAAPLNEPDEEEMQKVKSVYAEGIPSSWDEKKLREIFKKFGDIERVVLSRNIKLAKRKDFAFINYTTRDAALSCIESFDTDELTDNGSKVNLKVSLAKPVHKSKQNKGVSKSSNKDNAKDRPKIVQRDAKGSVPSSKGRSFNFGVGEKSSTNQELLQVLREQATWKPGQVGYPRGPAVHDYAHAYGGKRAFSSLGEDAPYSDLRGYPRARIDSSIPVAGSSYNPMAHSMPGSSMPYYSQPNAGYQTGEFYGAADRSSTFQTRQGGAPYGSGYYSRY